MATEHPQGASAATVTTDPALDGPATIDEDDVPGPGNYGFPRRMRPLREGLGLCLIVGITLVLVYKLWRLHPNIPMSYAGDGTFNDMMTKSIRENGWLLHNPRIGAPFSGKLYDFPQGGENAQFALEKLIGYVTPSWGATINAFFLSTFFLVALSAYFTARYLKLGSASALVVAVLYAFLPFHLWHGAAQATRAGYYIVPLAALVMLWLVDYRTWFLENDRLALSSHRWRFVAAIVICLVLGGSDTQNSLFAVCILSTIAVLLTVANRDLRPLAIGAVLCVVILGSLGLNNAPAVLYRHSHGPNREAAHRSILDVDTFSLSFARLVLPTRDHRITKLSHLEDKARNRGVVHGESGEALGMVGSFGLFVALIIAFGRMFRGSRANDVPRRSKWPSNRLEPFVARLGGLAAIALLFAMTGGISYLFALGGFTLLRTWNRIVLYIGFFALLTVGLLLNTLFRRWQASRGRAGIAMIAAITLLAIGLGTLDQTSVHNVPAYKSTTHRYNNDELFFKTLEKRLPHAAMVFQYPVIPFPENPPVGAMFDYDQFKGYLHTKDLRWSYGAIRGRPEADWQNALDDLPTNTAMAGLAAVGFQGVYINRGGYTLTGPSFEDGVRAALGAPMLTSEDDRLVYYDLAPMRKALDEQLSADGRRALRNAILAPVTVGYGPGFYGSEGSLSTRWRWAQKDAVLVINNPGKEPASVGITATLSGAPGTVQITGFGPTRTVAINSVDTAFSATARIPPGDSAVTFHTKNRFVAPTDSRDLYLKVTNLGVGAAGIADALCRFEPVGPTRPAECG